MDIQKGIEPQVMVGLSDKADAGCRKTFGALIPALRRAVADKGYTTPTPIQQACIPHVLDGRDLTGCAQTGTGKTAAFVLPILQRLSANKRKPARCKPRALVLAPTRELAAQIGNSISDYARHLPVSHTVIFGGVKQYHQVKALNRGVDMLVATPGRLLDLMRQGHVSLDHINVFVLDEVDRMLDMGFIPDIQQILTHVPEQRQTLFFSATLSGKVMELAQTMVRDPICVAIEPEKPTVDRIAQQVLFVCKKNKDALLISLFNDRRIDKAIVFTQMKHSANKVVDKLEAAGIRGAAIHSNKTQSARTRALNGFKKGYFQVLVATDVAARGLDVDDITHVINYDLPIEAETYIHRIGRTARAGANGDAISFCSIEERAYLYDIERLLGQSVPRELEHAYHCDKALQSTRPTPANFGKKRGNYRQQRRPQAGRRNQRSKAN